MTHLTDPNLTSIQQYLDSKLDRAASLGLSVSTEDDMNAWKRVVDRAGIGCDGALDPDLNNLVSGAAFWLKLTNQAGDIVAVQANRFIEAQDYINEWIRPQRMFGSKKPSLHLRELELCPNNFPSFSGRLHYGGGGWVHPDLRGQRIAGLMSRICRALALRHYLTDYYIAHIKRERRNYTRFNQGLANVVQLTTGNWPGRDNYRFDVDLCWMTRHEILDQIHEELDQELDSPPMTRTA